MASKKKIKPSLGLGIYTMADVARYTGISYQTVYSWFRARGVFDSDFEEVGDSFAVSFYDLVDSMVANAFRQHGVSLQKIRAARDKLRKTLSTPHPFCHRGLYTDGRRILVEFSKSVTGLEDAQSRQSFFKHIKKQLHNVSYSTKSRLANSIKVARGVEMRPDVAMGHPVIEGTGLRSYIVQRAYYANSKDKELVANLYGLSEEQVDWAVDYEDSAGAKAA